MSPLVPWQPVHQPAEAAAAAQHQGGSRRLWAATDEADEDEAADDDADDEAGSSGNGGKTAAAPGAAPAAGAPPPAPPGAEAAALLAELDSGAKGGYPRHVCIQGKLENSRRNYTAAFEAIRCGRCALQVAGIAAARRGHGCATRLARALVSRR